MANVNNPNGFIFVKSLVGSDASPVIWEAEVAASQTIAIGDALAITSGQVVIAASSSAQLLGFAVEAIVVAGGATGIISFIPALPHYVFQGQCSGTFAQSIMFTGVDIEGTTGIMEINENATTEVVVRPIALSKVTYAGTANTIGLNSRVDFVVQKSVFTGFEAGI